MNQVVRETVLICFLAIPPAIIAAIVHPQGLDCSPQPLDTHEIFIDQAKQWQNVLWVDARSQSAYQEDHIPQAILLNEDNWDALLPNLLERWKPGVKVIVYCDSSACKTSHNVAGRLRNEVGLQEVSVLKDGWLAWQRSL